MFGQVFKKYLKPTKKMQNLTNISKRGFASNWFGGNNTGAKIDPRQKKFNEFLKNVADYEENLGDNLHPYSKEQGPLAGFATGEGTMKYMERNNDIIPEENFKTPFNSDLKISSLGVGTYVGAPDDETDYYMYNGIKTSVLSGGINMIDTAINYRYQKSERVVGAVLDSLVNKYGYTRDEFFVATKGGFIADDSQNGIPGRIIIEDLISEGKLKKEDVIQGNIHCIHPAFLEKQLDLSLKNMNLETVDLYYLHNAYEMQGPNHSSDVVMDRLGAAFEFLESKVEEGKIKNYGMATWLCFRAQPSEEKIYLNLQKVVEMAEKVCGKDNNFNYIQAPINVMMAEAFVEPWQEFAEQKGDETVTTKEMLVAICNILEINLVSSQPLFQGKLAGLSLPNQMGVENVAARHLQLIRSIPTR